MSQSSIRVGPVAVLLVVSMIANVSLAQRRQYTATTDGGCLVVTSSGQPVLKYRYADAPPKPYVKELFTPLGVQVLRDSPADHVHHRGLMFGIFVNGVDFWSEQKAFGKQFDVGNKQSHLPTNDGSGEFQFHESLKWKTQDGSTLIDEQRTIEIHGAARTATLLTWRTKLRPETGAQAKFTGSHYDGLGVRFLQSMDRVGKFRYARGEPGPIVRGTERVTPAKWAAYTAPADGKPVTVALFDHPSNPRHPAGMFTMIEPFAYLSATPNIWKEPLELTAGQALSLTYGVAVFDGDTATAQIESLYGQWLELAKERREP